MIRCVSGVIIANWHRFPHFLTCKSAKKTKKGFAAMKIKLTFAPL